MAKPTVRVRIGFVDGPYATAPTWTDVTSYVRSINTSRGRTDDWQNFDSGNATVVLDNRDRRYDPTYAAGPYYGNLLPRRQIRIDATTDAVTYYNIFVGFIDGWPVNLTNAGYDSTVTITCYDALGLLAQDKCPDDWADSYILSLNPSRYWKLDDLINPANIPSTAGTLTDLKLKDYGSNNVGLSPRSVNTPTANGEPIPRASTSRSITWTVGNWYTTESNETFPVYTAGGGSIWFIAQAGSNYLWRENSMYPAVSGHFIEAIYNSNSGTLTLRSEATGNRLYTATVNITLGVAHHFAFRYTGSGSTFTPNIYLDGVELATVLTSPASTVAQPYGMSWLGISAQQIVAFLGTTPTADQLRTIYQLGNNVLTESTSARFDRIRAQTPFSASLCDTPVSPAGTVADLTTGGAFIKAELQLTADSEGGELYVNKSGRIVMTSRTYFETGNSLTNQATFGVGGIPIGTEMSYYWSAENIRNTLEIGWAGDASYAVSDTDSVNTYGVCQDSYDTSLSTLADVQNLGSYLVGFGKLPRLVMSAVEVNQALSAAQWATVLGLELLDRITVVVDEPVGSDLSQIQLVQQIEHDITPGDWRTRILGSSRWSSYFILDTSTLDGTDLLG